MTGLGITQILNCASAAETQTNAAFYATISYTELGAADEEDYDVLQHLGAVHALLADRARRPGQQRVLVHCARQSFEHLIATKALRLHSYGLDAHCR